MSDHHARSDYARQNGWDKPYDVYLPHENPAYSGRVQLAAMDVVEVSPPYDHADITASAAHRCVLEAISALAARKLDGHGVRFEPTTAASVGGGG
jgi:hypothetical protein